MNTSENKHMSGPWHVLVSRDVLFTYVYFFHLMQQDLQSVKSQKYASNQSAE